MKYNTQFPIKIDHIDISLLYFIIIHPFAKKLFVFNDIAKNLLLHKN